MEKRSYRLAFRGKYLAVAILFTMLSCKVQGQYTYPIHVPMWYDFLKVGKQLQVDGKSTFKDTTTLNKVRLITNNFNPNEPDSFQLRVDNTSNTGASGLLLRASNSTVIGRAWLTTIFYGSGSTAEMGVGLGTGVGNVFSTQLTIRPSAGVSVSSALSVSGTSSFANANVSGSFASKGSTAFGLTTVLPSSSTLPANSTGAVLPTLFSNQTLTLTPNGVGQMLILINTNTAASYSWSIAGATLKKADGTTITTLDNGKTYILLLDSTGTNYYVLNQ